MDWGGSQALALAARGARVVVNDLGGGPDGTGTSVDPAELVRDHLDEIRRLEGYTIPLSATDEMLQLMPLLQG